ncbi:hypothetical protein ACFVGY_20020 [Streptomyces sp. NPDC127106]|uniref:hypothetical protein n=1 Tax=Streptomyces sp. NPDC127106 TaxID=3345360 RepID=UPI003629FBA3
MAVPHVIAYPPDAEDVDLNGPLFASRDGAPRHSRLGPSERYAPFVQLFCAL